MARRKRAFDKGRWQVERERHHVGRAVPPSQEASVSIGDVVPQVLKQLGLENRLWEQALVTEWTALVGPQVAAHARPGRLERKTLHIFVSHPIWLSELSRFSQPQILANLQKRFGADRIKALRLQLDPEAK